MFKRIGPRSALILTALFTGSCSFLDLRPERTAPEEFRRAVEVQQDPERPARPRRFQPPPEAVTQALIPDLGMVGTVAPGMRARERRFDVSVMNADARVFFMGLVADGDHNVVVHPGVSGQITIDLKDVTLPEVLEAIREVYGYDYKRTPSGYIVFPAELMSRIFHVDYLNATRNGRSETRVSAGQSSQLTRGGVTQVGNLGGVSGFGGQGGMAGPTGYGAGAATGLGADAEGQDISDCRTFRGIPESNGTEAGMRGSQPGRGGLPFIPGSVVATTSISHFWKELKQALAIMVCSVDGADFAVNQQSGVVLVRAYPKQLRDVEKFLEAMGREVQREVVIEAKILEVVLRDGYQAGINWASLIRAGEASAITTLAGPVRPPVGVANLAQVFTIQGSKGDFSVFIELLETQGEVHTLSSPRISTLNNQKAVIKVGNDEFFVTNVSTTNVASASTTTIIPNIELTPFFSGIALDVTPQIGEGGEVTLHIHPSVTEVQDQIKRLRVGGEEQELPLAFSRVRESDSVVQARNGQIVVIGGLMQNVERTDRQGVAWLSRIPGLGSLFRRGQGTFEKSELVILLKPTVIGETSGWNKVRGPVSDRVNRLENESRQDPLP